MLIIAQPKSASTSLIYTMGELTGLKVKSITIDKQGKNCPGFKGLQGMHSNMTLRDATYIKKRAENRNIIFREHILPCDEHLKILDTIESNIIILLRNPDYAYDCYERAVKGYPRFKKLLPEIKKDLKTFYIMYLKIGMYKRNFLYIYYDNLVMNYEKTMKQIFNHFKLSIPKSFGELKKMKFTGVGLKKCLNQV
jgi:hypothetical protein